MASVALCGPAPSSPASSHVTLPYSPSSFHSDLLSALLIILFLTMKQRLCSVQNVVPSPLWLISLHLSELEEVCLPQASVPDFPD